MKNRIILFVILILTLFCVGCNKLGKEVNSQFIDLNVDKDYSKSISNEYLNFYIVNYQLENESSFPLLTVSKDNKLGVYSVITNSLIFDFQEVVSIEYLVNFYFPNYFVVTYKDNQKALYDYNGNIMLVKGSYNNINVSIVRTIDKSNYIYNETITYFSNESNEQLKLEFVSYGSLQNRKVLSSESLAQGNKITFVPVGIDLEHIGLKDYYLIMLKDNHGEIYNNKNQLISTINFNIDCQYYIMFAGCFYYQQVLLLDDNDKDYDFAIEVNGSLLKYKLITNCLDLKTGSVKEIDLDYLIVSGAACRDRNGIYKYANVKVQFIKNKRLTPSESYIIDADGAIRYNFSNNISVESLIKLDSEHYFDNNIYRLYDNDMNLLFDFSNNNLNISFEGFDFYNKIIKCMKNDLYGLINYELNVLLPFEYNEIGEFVSGRTYAYKNDQLLIIDLNGNSSETFLNKMDNCPILYNCLKEGNKYHYTLYKYNGEELFDYYSIDENGPDINKYSIDNKTFYCITTYNDLDQDNDMIFIMVTSE